MAPWMWVKSANTLFQAISGDLTAEHFNFLGGVSHKLAKSFKTRNKNVFQVAPLLGPAAGTGCDKSLRTHW